MIRGVGKGRIVLQDDTLQDYFADNAPQGIHDLHKQAAYIYNNHIYIAYADVPNQLVYVMAYDIDREKWSDRINIGTLSTADSHKDPSILVDSNGIIHIFYNAHTGFSEYLRSTNPEDISEWTTMPNITDHMTYPQAFEMPNGDIYLFYRGETGVGGGHDADWVYRISTDGGDTWGAETHILDGWLVGAVEHGWYATFNQKWYEAAEDIYCGFQYIDETVNPDDRFNAYFMWYDSSASQWKNAAGVNITGMMPLNLANANGFCLVRNSAARKTTCARGKLILKNDPNERFCVVYSEENAMGFWDYKYADWWGGIWNIRNVGVSGTTANDNCCLAGRGLALYLYAEEGADVEKWRSVNVGVNWNKVSDVVIGNGNNPQIVRNCDEDDNSDDYVILGTTYLYLYQHTIDDFIKNYMPSYSHTFEGFEQTGLIQIAPIKILDTDDILKMDAGNKKEIIKGWDINFTLPINYLEGCHNSNLETFLYDLIDWMEKIKLTPHEDRWYYTYHVILKNSQFLYRSIHELKEDSSIEMETEVIETTID